MHLTMDQLLAARDGDRSEPAFAEAARHLEACASCRAELDALHQRTAKLRALATLAPATDHFPEIRERFLAERRHGRQRLAAMIGLAAAASVAFAVVVGDLVRPPVLDASAQLRTAISRSQQLETKLREWNPDERVIDGRTAEVVIIIEERIAKVDARIAEAARLERAKRLVQEVELWQERVGLMDALVKVHVTRASSIEL